jgi:hypothetical protein
MLGRRMLENAIDHRDATEPPATENRRDTVEGFEPACFLRPPDLQLQMHPASGDRIEATPGAPRQEAPQSEWA